MKQPYHLNLTESAIREISKF